MGIETGGSNTMCLKFCTFQIQQILAIKYMQTFDCFVLNPSSSPQMPQVHVNTKIKRQNFLNNKQ